MDRLGGLIKGVELIKGIDKGMIEIIPCILCVAKVLSFKCSSKQYRGLHFGSRVQIIFNVELIVLDVTHYVTM